MAPVILACKNQGMHVKLIDTGQHAATTVELRHIFSLPQPYFLVPERVMDVAMLSEGLCWLGRLIVSVWRCRRQAFANTLGSVLVHGDTASTLIGAVMGRIAGYPIIHIESGLRSWSWFHPFPEEIIRWLVMHMSTFLIAPSLHAKQNIDRMGLGKKCIYIQGNTVADALGMTWTQTVEQPSQILACIHRMETLQSKTRFAAILNHLIKLQMQGWQVIFVQHPATENVIKKMGYRLKMVEAGIRLLPIQPYDDFLELMGKVQVVIADGGSIQEECALLGKYCLVPRQRSERQDGLGQCVHLVDCDWQRWEQALKKQTESSLPYSVPTHDQPSKAIATWLALNF
ncbi:MAG: UDP-N-acetylglucosamine 2-epimerase [Mariprofundales bacterium]